MTSPSKIFVGLKSVRGSKAAPKNDTIGPKCHWDGCDQVGLHRAPVGQEGEGLFFLFCTEHVKEYNRGYNYSSSLSSPEVARYQKEAASGLRKASGKPVAPASREAPLPSMARSGSAKSINAARSAAHRKAKDAEARKRKLRVLEARAFETLGLPDNATPEDIRARYKLRLKMLHPDANQGSRTTEDEMRATIEAYKILKLNDFC